MLGWNIVPSWLEIQSRMANAMGPQGNTGAGIYPNETTPNLPLVIRRVHALRSAFIQAEWIAADRLRQRFSALDISSILNDLIDIVGKMAMIIAGGALTGGTIGAAAGAFLGGVGTIPGSAAGIAMGIQVSTWFLGILGLSSIAEFFANGFPSVLKHYLNGIDVAWHGVQNNTTPGPFSHDAPFAEGRAAQLIAEGHVETVALLLGAIVAYLTRGRGNAATLAQEMARSPKGARLGQWMLKHEDALTKRPNLQAPGSHKSAPGDPTPHSPNRPSDKHKKPDQDKPNRMVLHVVRCFTAENMDIAQWPEFERQLKGQQDGLNKLTVQEFLQNVEGSKKRSKIVAKRAKKHFYDKLISSLQRAFLKQKETADKAEEMASEEANNQMEGLAGLHNPDLVAGGFDVISDFGDSRVNSSIGAQWPTRITTLKLAAYRIPEKVRANTFINANLHKC